LHDEVIETFSFALYLLASVFTVPALVLVAKDLSHFYTIDVLLIFFFSSGAFADFRC